MDNGTHDPFSVSLIAGTLLYFFALMFISHVRYKQFLKVIKKSGAIEPSIVSDYESSAGTFIGGKFYGRMPLPITLESEDLLVAQAVKRHNNSIKLWWLSCLILLPIVIIVLNIRGK